MRWRFWRRRAKPIPWGGFGLSSPFVEGPRILALQLRLAERGIPVEATGAYDLQTAEAVRLAKDRHRIVYDHDTADRATPELLGKLGL